jgi:hypothetical protein
MMASKTAQLIGLVANVGATYIVVPKLGVRGDLGIGVAVVQRRRREPVHEQRADVGRAADVPPPLGVSADYAITPNFDRDGRAARVLVQPAAVGPARGHQVDPRARLHVGFGYRM